MEKSYFDERRLDTESKIKQLLFELPEFVEDFFIGIETTTSPLTRLGYARDLLIFFDYLYTNSRKFYGLDKDTFTLKHLNRIEAFDIEKFIEKVRNLQKRNERSVFSLLPFLFLIFY